MALKGLSLLSLLAVTLALGCGAEENKTPTSPNETAADKTAAIQQDSSRSLNRDEQALVGVWLGQAALEETLVEVEFESQPDDQAKGAFVDQAEAFLSTVMAIQFKSDGTFEQDIEQAVSGIRQTGKGTWKVLQRQEDQWLVETVESDSEGNQVVAKRLFKVYADGKSFAMPAPVSDSLAKCNPRLVFAKQNEFADERTAQAEGSQKH